VRVGASGASGDRRRASLLTLGVATLVALVVPATAAAHGLIQRANLPIPEWLFGWAAAIVLVVSFLALALLWPQPRLEGSADGRPVPRIGRFFASRTLENVCQVIGALLLVLVLVAGFAGTQDADRNFAPLFIFITFWVGLAFASALFGDIFRAFNPWRAWGRAAGWVVTRLRGGAAPSHRPYPERLGRWPAAAGLLCFAWLELASAGWGQEPDLLAAAASVYTVAMFAGMAIYGVEPWVDRGDGFSVYFNLFSRIAVFGRRDGVVRLRRPLSALTELQLIPGTIAVIVVMIGTVTYDGLEQGAPWAHVAQRLDKWFDGLGLGPHGLTRITGSIGIAVGVGAVALFYWLGVYGARSVGGEQTARRLARGFVHSLVPIALVYVAAHYLTFFVFEGQQITALASDPLGKGWDLFGTAGHAVNYGVLSQDQTWYLQVGIVVAGHVCALILAHERALVLYRAPKLAVRSQYWMLGVMVGFTSLALWLLAEAGTALNVAEASSSKAPASASTRLVDLSKKPPFVNGLGIDPNTKDFLLTTNRGFWRISPDGKKVTQIRGRITYEGKSDTVGTFLLAEPVGGQKLIGSGHPDHQNTLPQFLGYIESDDMGKTWHALSRVGDADLHKIEFGGDRMYAYDAVLSAILTTDDQGRHFTEHFAPRGLIIDFVVDPSDRDVLLAANDDELFRSKDGGDSWKSVLKAPRIRLAWPAPANLYRANQDGEVFTSADGGKTWEKASKVTGEPYKFRAVGPEHLYLALSTGAILETTDGAKTWKTLFTP
jgi:Photosynthesis system II assembly factor YCF48